jgi:hypothetical protein
MFLFTPLYIDDGGNSGIPVTLQSHCHNLILFSLYIGDGGSSGDPVGDGSREVQGIGRVFRPSQPHPVVNVYRIEARGRLGQDCLDGL